MTTLPIGSAVPPHRLADGTAESPRKKTIAPPVDPRTRLKQVWDRYNGGSPGGIPGQRAFMEALVDMREISLSTLEATGIVPHSEMSNDDATDHFEFFLRGAYYVITTQTFHKMQQLKNRFATKSTKLANRSRVERIQWHLETVIKDLEIDNDIKDWGFDGFILSGIHQHPHRLPEAELRQISELFENFDGLNCLRAMQALLLLINLPRDKGGSETTSSAAPFVAAAASFWHSVKNGGGIDRRRRSGGEHRLRPYERGRAACWY